MSEYNRRRRPHLLAGRKPADEAARRRYYRRPTPAERVGADLFFFIMGATSFVIKGLSLIYQDRDWRITEVAIGGSAIVMLLTIELSKSSRLFVLGVFWAVLSAVALVRIESYGELIYLAFCGLFLFDLFLLRDKEWNE